MIENMLAGLTPAQKEAAMAEGPVLVLAGAGTGKTKTLTSGFASRIQYRNISPERILAVTFTNKAAGEMKHRITSLLNCQSRLWIGTFHGLAARQLREAPAIAGLETGFEIIDMQESLAILKRIVLLKIKEKEEGYEEIQGDDVEESLRKQIQDVSRVIAKLKDNMVLPQNACFWLTGNKHFGSVSAELLERIYHAYQEELRRQNKADFGDLLLWVTNYMAHSESYRQAWAKRFDCVMADEYQDINYIQHYWLYLLAKEHREIFAVGDDGQAIYGWRGGVVDYIRRFPKEYPGTTLIRLEENFRSTSHILAAANAVIAKDEGRVEKNLYTNKEIGNRIEHVTFWSAHDEAKGVVAEIARRLVAGKEAKDIAILYRANWLSRAFEEALLHQKIPYVIVGDTGFYQRSVIKDALAFLKLCAYSKSPQSDEAFRRIVNKPARGVGGKKLAKIEQKAIEGGISLFLAMTQIKWKGVVGQKLEAFMNIVQDISTQDNLTVSERLDQLLNRTGYMEWLKAEQKETGGDSLKNIQELQELSKSFDQVEALLEHAALATSAPGEDQAGRVQLMTIHKAKGLEFPEVYLVGWEQGIFPPSYGDPAEEIRLAYVAITRGKERVCITTAQNRRGMMTETSYFIGFIPEEHLHKGWIRKRLVQSNRRYIQNVY